MIGEFGGAVEHVSWQEAGTSESRPVVILGASYAAGWKLTDLDGMPIVNAGVAGQQSFEMLARFDADVAAARPRAVVLWGFINDIFRASDTTQSLARMRESYIEMTKRARAQDIEPIVATEVTIRPPKTFVEAVTVDCRAASREGVVSGPHQRARDREQPVAARACAARRRSWFSTCRPRWPAPMGAVGESSRLTTAAISRRRGTRR